MLRLLFTFGIFFVAGVGSVSAQIVIEDYNLAANNRFSNDPNFIGAGFDLSGVARASNSGRWGTLIGPNAVVTAFHARPSVGSIFEFYPDNDPNSTPVEAIVTKTLQVGNSDLSIALLDRNVNPSIAVYDFTTQDYTGTPPRITTNSDGSTSVETFFNTDSREVEIIGERVLVVGIGDGSNPSLATNQAVGENRVTSYAENVVFGTYADNDSIILENDSLGSPDALTYETHVRGGDSGGPNFLIDSTTGDLVLLGVNSFRFDGTSSSTFQSSGVTYAGNQVEEINEILSDPENIIVLGDCSLDGRVNFLDISPFISLLASGDYLGQADMNRDGRLSFTDISLFIRLLSPE